LATRLLKSGLTKEQALERVSRQRAEGPAAHGQVDQQGWQERVRGVRRAL